MVKQCLAASSQPFDKTMLAAHGSLSVTFGNEEGGWYGEEMST